MRTKLRSKFTLFFIVCAALLAFPAMASALVSDPSGTTPLSPTIASNEADYRPGATVTLTGSNWQPGEAVHINVNDDQGQTWSRDADVTADAGGNITDQFQLPSTFVAVYKVTATGAQSGVATTTFTDGNVGVTSSPVATGTSQVLFKLDWKLHNGSNANPNNNCSVTNNDTSGSQNPVGSTTIGGSKNNFTQGVPNNNSLRLEAAATANQPSGWTFKGWTASSGTFTTLDPANPRVICVKSDGGDFLAVYQQNADTKTTVTSSSPSNTSTYGDSVTFTANVAATMNGVSNPSGVGTVTFKDGATTLCTANLSGNTATCTTSDLSAAASPHSITAQYSGGTNYSGSTSSALTQTVNKANTTTTVSCTAGPFTYTGSAHTPCSANVTGPNGLNESVSVSYSNNVDAGTVTASASYTESANYKGSSDSETFVIAKANATIDVQGYDGPYDGNAHGATTATATGVNDEDLSSLLHANSTFTDAPGGTGSWTFDGNTNYNNTSGSFAVKIARANITVTADAKSKVQGQPDPTFTYQVTGKPANGAAISGVLTRDAGFESPGTYPILQGTVDNTTNTNYNITYVGANLTITPACLTTAKFQPPFKDNAELGLGMRNIVKAGNVVPVKLSLLDCNNAFVGGKTLAIKVFSGVLDASDVEDGSTALITESVSSADTTGFMRQVDGQYIYNLSTKSLTTGKDFTIAVKDLTAPGSTWETAGTRLASAVIQTKK